MLVPDPTAIEIFFDLAVPQEGRSYLSYATVDRRLKLATFDESDSTFLRSVPPRAGSGFGSSSVRRRMASTP
jgi:hypothetical protein